MKPFTTLALIIFALMAFAHLYRLLRPFEVVVAGNVVPQWVSFPALLVAALLALMIGRESRK
jgi:hypothetical protein